MSITTISSRFFNQDLGAAKRAADNGPVLITDRGKPAYVLLKHEEWRRLVGEKKCLLDTLDLPGTEDIVFEPSPLKDGLFKAADLS